MYINPYCWVDNHPLLCMYIYIYFFLGGGGKSWEYRSWHTWSFMGFLFDMHSLGNALRITFPLADSVWESQNEP